MVSRSYSVNLSIVNDIKDIYNPISFITIIISTYHIINMYENQNMLNREDSSSLYSDEVKPQMHKHHVFYFI